MAETRKLKSRWQRDGIYDKYITGQGIDIGCGRNVGDSDPISDVNCIHHDRDDCDATTMAKYADNTFDYVYSSHVIEHLSDPVTAVANWVRICKPGGYVIIYAPHRDYYEGKKQLPSDFNHEHKYYYLTERSEPPCTFSMKDLISGHGCEVIFCRDANEGWSKKEGEHGKGEYSIEAVMQKL